MKHARFAALVLTTIGCSRDPLVGDGAADGGVDALAADFAPACTLHRLLPVEALALTAVDPPEALAVGRAVRLRVDLALGADDLPAEPSVEIVPGDATDFVTLSLFAWRAATPSPARTLSQFVTLPPIQNGNRMLAVRDSVGAPVLLLTLAAAPAADCGVPAAADCQLDCQCASPRRCIPVSPSHGLCMVPCDHDADCAGAAWPGCVRAPGGPPVQVCGPGGGCAVDGDCPFGQRCVIDRGVRACRPAPPGQPPDQCACDGDCPAGTLCGDDHGVMACVVPCVSDGDCAPSLRCQRGACSCEVC